MNTQPEVWLSGNRTPGLNPYLQPLADALYQALREIKGYMTEFPENKLWEKPVGMASVGFHVIHIAGVLDRLLTYAEGKSLSPDQFQYLQQEKEISSLAAQELVLALEQAVLGAIDRMKSFSEADLLLVRTVGRAALPTTVLGLCTHAAEHTMRHTGQLLVTSQLLKNS